MNKKVTYYKKLLKNGASNNVGFLKSLTSYYGQKPLITNLINFQGNQFVIFNNALDEYVEEYEKLAKEALSLRTSRFNEYLSSGYVVSEINSSLRAEGVNSTAKMVKQIIEAKKKEGSIHSENQVSTLINNMHDSLSLITNSALKINEKNIFFLYSMLTKGIEKNIIEDNQRYRLEGVTIGNDSGANPESITSMMQELCLFIEKDDELPLIIKALVSHYYFELIHPYYDYNGRMGRLLHLWILNKSPNEFWKNIYLSEAIYAFKDQFDSIFNKYLYAKKKAANIDLTYFIGKMIEMFNLHTKCYIQMKKLEITSQVKLLRMSRLFIIDMLLKSITDNRWFTLRDFQNIYDGYSSAMAQKILRNLQQSKLCEFKNEKPVRFRLK